MAHGLSWQPEADAAPGAPRSPYAHDAWRRAGGAPGPRADLSRLLGDLAGLDPAWRRDVGDLLAVPEAYGLPDLWLPLRLAPEVLGPEAGFPAAAPPPAVLPADDTVFVGVIDDGVAFAHARFRSHGGGGPERTRVDMLWQQGADHRPGAVWGFGRELFARDIDALLARHRTGPGRVDEASLYREAGAIRMLRRAQAGPPTLAFAASHGTAVADLAAGFDPRDPRGERVRLLVVNLPPSVSEDTSGAFLDGYLALGIERILRHVALAEQAAGRAFPVIVVIALATTAGPKDGTGLLDRVMAMAARLRRRAGRDVRFVLPAGNARQAMLRAEATLGPGGTRDIGWRLAPDDRTPSYAEIWGPPLPEGAPRAFDVGLAPPGLAEPVMLPPLPAGARQAVLRRGGRELARAYLDRVPAASGAATIRDRVVLVAPPTIADGAAAPPGDWTIRLGAGPAGGVRVDLFIQRDDTLPGFRHRGRQSRFVDPAYRRRDPGGHEPLRDPAPSGMVRRAGTLNALACGDEPAVETVGGLFAGAADGLPGREAPYSGLGFADRAAGGGPRFLEVCERSPARPGILAAGTLSGPRLALGGTSVAAPQRARRLIG